MILSNELEINHILEVSFPLEEELLGFLKTENWQAIDHYFLMSGRPNGALYSFLQNYLDFTSIEHIIAIRSAPGDEDGIWHDDGSRILGFTISLTEKNEEIVGGELRFKKKSSEDFRVVSTRKLGQMMLFKTGIYGFEHMVTAVTNGKRIVIAGWCS